MPSENGLDLLNLPPGYAINPAVEAMLANFLTNYRPSEQGVCAVLSEMRIVLPVGDWATSCWSERVDVAYTAALNDHVIMVTVPPNERWKLVRLSAIIASGDNTITSINIVGPTEYASQAGLALNMIDLGTPVAGPVIWPDIAGRQTVDQWYDGEEMLVEPGTEIRTFLAGAGASGGNVRLDFWVNRTKLTHARPLVEP